MLKSMKKMVREVLLNSDGMTLTELAAETGRRRESLRNTLYAMEDAYIDRWLKPGRYRWAAVWRCAEIPSDCPKPERKNFKMETAWLVKLKASDGKIVYIHFLAKEYEDAIKDAKELHPEAEIISCKNLNGKPNDE